MTMREGKRVVAVCADVVSRSSRQSAGTNCLITGLLQGKISELRRLRRYCVSFCAEISAAWQIIPYASEQGKKLYFREGEGS